MESLARPFRSCQAPVPQVKSHCALQYLEEGIFWVCTAAFALCTPNFHASRGMQTRPDSSSLLDPYEYAALACPGCPYHASVCVVGSRLENPQSCILMSFSDSAWPPSSRTQYSIFRSKKHRFPMSSCV